MDNYVITIGRQFGAGGRELGQKLAEKLGIPFYDKQLLYKAAAQSGMNPDLFVENDERMPKYINGAISFNYGMGAMPWYANTSAISDENIYHALSDFIRKLAQQGPCVIVGRSADYVLREHHNVVSVFLHANIDDRVSRIIGRSDTTDAAKARKMCEKVDKLRANYYNFYTDKKWGHSTSYDLTLNSSLLPMDEIVEVVAEYVKRRSSR